jgi:hypothetical protein
MTIAMVVIFGLLVVMYRSAADQPKAMQMSAPEFTNVTAWLNSKPLKLADLKGQVVVVHFWTFG